MPVTNGHGNADWTRDETVLALDLLYRHGRPIGRQHEDIITLSSLLRRAPFHPPEKRQDSFRNPDGVALKLQNLLSAVEPGRGLSYSKTDLAVVLDYPSERQLELANVALAIRTALERADSSEHLAGDEEEFIEGRWLTVRHRQRDARLRRRLLDTIHKSTLVCEICQFTPRQFDRSTQESFFEAHHRRPLAEAEHERATRIADMALLCACCHRFIHKLIVTRRRWVGTAEARAILSSS